MKSSFKIHLIVGIILAVLVVKPAKSVASERMMTPKEYQFALSIFEREFPERHRITLTDSTGIGNRPYVRPTAGDLTGKGNIRINLGKIYYNTMELPHAKTFVHELTHAWQIDHYGVTWYTNQAVENQVIDDNPYTYKCDPSKKLSDYNAEQQGNIVRDYYLKMECPSIVARSLRSSTWKLMIGSSAIDLASGGEKSTYMINTRGHIYLYDGLNWNRIDGSSARSIAVNAGQVIMANYAGSIFRLTNGTWQQIPGREVKDVGIDSDGSIWIVNTSGSIYRSSGSAWQKMPGSDGARISAGGGQVWLVNSAGRIYRFNGSQWDRMAGSDGRDIAVSNSGLVFLTNTAGNIYRWNNGSWLKLDGSDGSAISASADKLYLANTSGRIYYRKSN